MRETFQEHADGSFDTEYDNWRKSDTECSTLWKGRSVFWLKGHAPESEFELPENLDEDHPEAETSRPFEPIEPRAAPYYPARPGSLRPTSIDTDSWRSMSPVVRKHILDTIKMEKELKESRERNDCAAATSAGFHPSFISSNITPRMPLRTEPFAHRSQIHYSFVYPACVARPVTKKEAKATPKAMEALDKEWNKLHKH